MIQKIIKLVSNFEKFSKVDFSEFDRNLKYAENRCKEIHIRLKELEKEFQ